MSSPQVMLRELARRFEVSEDTILEQALELWLKAKTGKVKIIETIEVTTL